MTSGIFHSLANSAPLGGFRIAERWGVISQAGYQAVPDVLLFKQRELGLTSTELNVLLNLTAHWWRQEDYVFPGVSTIARRMDVTKRSVQRVVSSLVAKGFIRKARTPEGQIYFDLSPLQEKLNPFAEQFLKERARFRSLSEALNG